MLKIKFERDSLEFSGTIEDLKALGKVIERAADPRQTKALSDRVANADTGKHLTLVFRQGKSEPSL